MVLSASKTINPLKRKVMCTTFRNSVLTAKKTPRVAIKEIHRLILFKEVISVFSENHTI
jgi:hypothetical protein